MRALFIIGLILSSGATSGAQEFYPTAPDQAITPGSLCTSPDAYRYFEQIPYCDRNVSSNTKTVVMALYMARFPNLNINITNRFEYKIDHFIPLCMGGSNEITNLWPQHESVFYYTDIIEFNLCTDLANATTTQEIAVSKMKFAKSHLDQVRLSADPMKYVEENFIKPLHPNE